MENRASLRSLLEQRHCQLLQTHLTEHVQPIKQVLTHTRTHTHLSLAHISTFMCVVRILFFVILFSRGELVFICLFRAMPNLASLLFFFSFLSKQNSVHSKLLSWIALYSRYKSNALNCMLVYMPVSEKQMY